MCVYDVVIFRLCNFFFPLDARYQLGSATVEVLVGEVFVVSGGVAPQDTLSKMWDFVESVHVKLPDEGIELLMLEPMTKDLVGKLLPIQY